MPTIKDFLLLVRDEVGLPVDADHADVHLDQVPGWDSVYLLSLVTVLERFTGHPVPLPTVLSATSLREIYRAVTA